MRKTIINDGITDGGLCSIQLDLSDRELKLESDNTASKLLLVRSEADSVFAESLTINKHFPQPLLETPA